MTGPDRQPAWIGRGDLPRPVSRYHAPRKFPISIDSIKVAKKSTDDWLIQYRIAPHVSQYDYDVSVHVPVYRSCRRGTDRYRPRAVRGGGMRGHDTLDGAIPRRRVDASR